MHARTLGLLLCTLAVISCAEPPVERVRTAHQDLAALEDLHAGRWAPARLEAASEAIESVEEELVAQNRRFAWNREYEKAEAMLALAGEDLARARSALTDAKLEAEELAREALEAASYAVEHARSALLIVPVARSVRHLDRDLTGTEGHLEEVRNLILLEDYSEAVVHAEKILKRVSTLLAAVSRKS